MTSHALGEQKSERSAERWRVFVGGSKLHFMGKPAVDISSLTLEERLDLIGEIWDSLDGLPPTLSVEQSDELRRRVDRVRRDGVSGVTIEELSARLTRA